MARSFGWGWGVGKGKQDKVSEYDIPELWRQRLMSYLGPELFLLILVEMAIVGRGLWIAPIIIGLVLCRRPIGLILWTMVAGVLVLFALTEAWWPVWWNLSFSEIGPVWSIRLFSWEWWAMPGILAAARILLGFIIPMAWLLATSLAFVRGVLEEVTPEVPNTPVKPIEFVQLLDLFGWLRPDNEDPETEEVRTTSVHDIPDNGEVISPGKGVNVGDGNGRRSIEFPTEWFRGQENDQKLLAQRQFAEYVLQDPENNYSRNRCAQFFSSGTRARWFFEWMKTNHFATQASQTDQALNGAGLHILRTIGETQDD